MLTCAYQERDIRNKQRRTNFKKMIKEISGKEILALPALPPSPIS